MTLFEKSTQPFLEFEGTTFEKSQISKHEFDLKSQLTTSALIRSSPINLILFVQ